MANEILQKLGTPVVWADTTDYSSVGSGFTRTAQIDLTSLAAGAARQGDKVDLGATRAARYKVYLGFEFDVAPAAGARVEVYLSWSASGTAGTGNAGGASGADGAYKAGEVDEWKKQLDYVGDLVATADAATTVQRQFIGTIEAAQRYVSPVIVNEADQAAEGDAEEMYLALVPIIDEVQ